MDKRVSSSSDSGLSKQLRIQSEEKKSRATTRALMGVPLDVTFDKSAQFSPITLAGKSVAAAASRGGAKNLGARNASGTRRAKKSGGKSPSRTKSKKGGTSKIEDVEDEEEISETEEKDTEGVLSIEGLKKQGKREQQQGLFARLERMARQEQISGLQDIIDAASDTFEDVSDAYDGLRAAQEHFGKSEEEILKNLSNSTRAAGDVLYKDQGPDIRAGYLFGPGTEETTSYRRLVLRFEKVSDTFKAIMEMVKGNSNLFGKEIDKLIKEIQIDMKAQESTLDPRHLSQIMQGLFKVQVCSQIEGDSKLLIRDMANLYPNTTQINNG